MSKSVFILFFCFVNVLSIYGQQTSIIGKVIDADSSNPLSEVHIVLKNTELSQTTSKEGTFKFNRKLPLGEYLLLINKEGYLSKKFQIIIQKDKTIDISTIILSPIINNFNDYTISLSDEELDSDESIVSNTSGILQASKDVFSKAAAYDFSSTFFKVRGLGSENSSLLLNGVKMNKAFNGRPQWNNWGGINGVMRNQEFINGSKANAYTFGNIAGTTNINLRASEYRKSSSISYASTSRTYKNRLMATYASGVKDNGWAYVFSVGARWASEGYLEGTIYQANSVFSSIEKKINDKQSINLTAIYTPNKRGKSASVTQEVFNLKGNKYNPFWGIQNGEIRNSRVREIKEPIFILSHYWDVSDKIEINTNLSYQFGATGSSRIDFNGENPNPDYYKNLPSYALRFDSSQEALANAYVLEQEFLNDGQLNWNSMYDANISNPDNAVYVLYQDRNDDKQITLNTILDTELSDNIILNGAINYSSLRSHNYAKIIDLLGATSYIDKDYFSNIDSNTLTPNRVVFEGDEFKYNYNINATSYSAFAQSQFTYFNVDFYFGGKIGKTIYQRDGLYSDGHFPSKLISGISSFGKGEKLDFTIFGAKSGLTYKISGKHLIDFNVVLIKDAPSIRNSFLNSRQNNLIVPDLTEVQTTAFDVSYIYRSPILNTRLTAYYSKIRNATELSFFYIDGTSGTTEATAFVQEATTNIEKRNIGIELGAEAKITSTIKLKGVLALGEAIYANNPNVYLSSDKFIDVATNPYDNATSYPNGVKPFGVSNLKNYKQSGGPQRAASIGFEYRDPKYWWFGATTNFFSNAYVDVSSVLRTTNFTLDQDGIPITDYDPKVSKLLLKQEKFENYMLLNFVGGKTFKISNKYIGFFASINNVLNEVYKTGGYEQSRNGNYSQVLADSQRTTKLFGSKYWFGRGTSYYMNIYVRF